MDPNVNLKEQLELAASIQNDDLSLADLADLADKLAFRVEALAAWLESGGFLPDAWQR